MKKYWVGITGKFDYMARYGIWVYANNLEEAMEIATKEYPDFTIDKVIEWNDEEAA